MYAPHLFQSFFELVQSANELMCVASKIDAPEGIFIRDSAANAAERALDEARRLLEGETALLHSESSEEPPEASMKV